MKRAFTPISVALAIALLALPASADVRQQVQLKAQPFSLTQVRLLDGPFKHAMDLDHKYLLSLDPDRLLHAFRVNAGLPSTAKPLGGWEEPKSEVRGHSMGHYLSACAMMYAATGDERLKQKAAYIVAELAKCQQKLPSGYLSAYPESFIDRVEALKPVWAPYYTIHKIYAGLLDVYTLCGNQQALAVLEKACQWLQARTDKLSDAQMEKMLGNEHGGMNDVLAELAAVTGKEKYLKLSGRFNHHAVLDPLSKRQDKLTGLHANTQFPKILGAARQYELTGGQSGRTIATFFWDTVTKERSYVTGGNSDGEMFTDKARLSEHLGPSTTETCNTYNMLKITRRIFCWEPKAEYGDYYERALLNHILGSQDPQTGMVLYYMPLRNGGQRVFGNPNDSFWCCTATGMESHAKYGDSIYFHDGQKALYVSQFIASEVSWKDRGLVLRQETKYPESDTTRLVLACEKPVELTLTLRHPYWAASGVTVMVNGQRQPVESTPGSWIALTRTWKGGNTVELKMPMTLRTEGFRDNPRRLAVFYGPVLLCSPVVQGKPFPAIVGEIPRIPAAIKPAGRPLEFTASPSIFRSPESPSGVEVALVPFYKETKRPYLTYWDVLNEAQWKARVTAYEAEQAREKALAGRTVDKVEIGNESSERAHKLQGERHGAGPYGARHWRHAPDGWFSYEMKVPAGRPVELLATYWGSDVPPREFDVLVDGVKIATQKLNRNRPEEFFDAAYPVLPEATKGKTKITVRFQAHPGNTAGGVFGLRVLRKE